MRMCNPTSMCLAALLSCSASALAQSQTDWTGADGNNLWSDPANWSNGVPDANSLANITTTTGPQDLGGSTWSVGRLHLECDGIQITNGTLSASVIDATLYSPWVSPVLDVTLTGVSGQLRLASSTPRYLRVGAPISGDISVTLLGGVRLAAPSQHTGPTIVAGGVNYLQEAGTLSHTSSLRLYGTLILNNLSTDRLPDNAPVEISGGYLVQPAGSERIGPVHFSDDGTIDVTNHGSLTSGLWAPALARDRNTVVSLVANPALGQKIVLDTAPVMVGAGTTPVSRPIIAGAGQVTYDSSADPLDPSHQVGVRPLDSAEYLTAIPAAGATDPAPNVCLSAPQTITGNVAVNSLSGSNIVLDHADLRVESGYLDSGFSGTGTISAPDELFIPIGRGRAMTVPLKAKSLLMTGDYGSVRFDAANDITDQVIIRASSVDVHNPAAFGSAKVWYPGDGTSAQVSVSDTMTLPNDIQLGRRNIPHLPGTTPVDYSSYVSIPKDRTLTLNGKLTGGNVPVYGTTGYLRLNGDATFSYLWLSGFQGVEINGTVSGETVPGGGHEAIISSTNLFGNGTLLGVFSEGTISPGDIGGGTGRLAVELLGGKLTYHCDITGAVAGQTYDQLVLLDRIAQGYSGYTSPILDLDPTVRPDPGTEFLILDNRGNDAYPGLFSGLPEGGTITANGVPFQITYFGGDGNDIVLTTVPEPSGIAILATIPLLAIRRRRP